MSDGPLDVLCLCAGQGRNAVYLASLGHRCVALDASETALRKTMLLGAQRLREGALDRLTTELCDLSLDGKGEESEKYPPSHDVVTDIFSSLDPGTRVRTLRRRVCLGLRPGGLYICECFAPRHDEVRAGRACGPTKRRLVSAEQLTRELGPRMEVLHSEEIETRINEGRFHRGKCVVTRLVARKLMDGPQWPTFGQTMRGVFSESTITPSGSKAGSLDAQFSDVARISGAACLDAESSAGAEGNGSVPDRLLFSASASVSIACTACTADKNVAEDAPAARALCRACWLHPSECLCDQILAAADAASDVAAPFQARFSVVCHPHEFMRSTSTAKIAVQVLGPERAQMLVVGGGAEQRCRLRALLEQKSASACPTFVLFPHAPTGADTISVREMVQQVSQAPSPPSPANIIVPDGSWECCRAMVNALHARQIQNSTNQLRYVHLDKDRVAYHSPLIESLKAGQGLGRISTLEAIALLLDEASGAAEAAVGAVAVRPVSSPLGPY